MANTEILKFERLQECSAVVHGIAAGYPNMSYRYGEVPDVTRTRLQFFKELGISAKNVVAPRVEHGCNIVRVTKEHAGRGALSYETAVPGDVLVTREKGLSLLLLVADCLALLIYDPVQGVVALAHVGWRGVGLDVPGLTIQYLEEKYQSRPCDLVIGLPPAQQAWKGPWESFPFKDDPRFGSYTSSRGSNTTLRWTDLAFDQLLGKDVHEHQISRMRIDTVTDNRFFSHHRSSMHDEPEGRFGVLIGLR